MRISCRACIRTSANAGKNPGTLFVYWFCASGYWLNKTKVYRKVHGWCSLCKCSQDFWISKWISAGLVFPALTFRRKGRGKEAASVVRQLALTVEVAAIASGQDSMVTKERHSDQILSAPKSCDSLRLRRRFLPLPRRIARFLRPQDARFPLRRKSLANGDFLCD